MAGALKPQIAIAAMRWNLLITSAALRPLQRRVQRDANCYVISYL